MSVAVLAGGVGAARYLSGLVQVLPPSEIDVIVNTADDLVVHGLYVSPDIDTITYTLSGAGDAARGWGQAGETWNVIESLARFGAETWFRLGDKDIATHLYRSMRLGEGATLTEVTAEISAAFGLELALLPMSDDQVRTRVKLLTGEEVAFQEYFVKLAHSQPIAAVHFEGAGDAKPGPRVLEALTKADAIVIAPSNPIVSIGPILAVQAIAELLAQRRNDVVAISPIVGGQALKGPADRMLVELGGESSVVGVADQLKDFARTLVIDSIDQHLAPMVEQLGLSCVVSQTVMSSPAIAANLARVSLGLSKGAS